MLSYQPKIQRMMKLFKKLFRKISKSRCSNTKFHNILHALDCIIENASLRLGDTGRGEQANGVVKHAFRGTNRKKAKLLHNLFRRTETIRNTKAVLRHYGVCGLS